MSKKSLVFFGLCASVSAMLIVRAHTNDPSLLLATGVFYGYLLRWFQSLP
jgi:hypothetical protein